LVILIHAGGQPSKIKIQLVFTGTTKLS